MAVDEQTDPNGPPPPVVPAETEMPELTLAPVLLGVILGIVFGASSLYLVLKVGMTVSASIPVAVLSITLFRLLPRSPRDDPRKQHRSDDRIGRRVDRLRRRRHDAGPAPHRLRPRIDAGDDRRRPRRIARHLYDDSDAAGVPRQAAPRTRLSRRPGRGADSEVGDIGGATAANVFAGFGIGFLFKFLVKPFYIFHEEVSAAGHQGRNRIERRRRRQ